MIDGQDKAGVESALKTLMQKEWRVAIAKEVAVAANMAVAKVNDQLHLLGQTQRNDMPGIPGV